MKINRDQFLEEGYLILRNVIPPDQLAGLRQAHETLVERQKVTWARQRGPNDPPGGFSMFTHYADLAYLDHLSAAAQAAFTRWNTRSQQTFAQIETVLRAALNRDVAAYLVGLEQLHPGRGEKGRRFSTICLSKSVKRIYHLKSKDFDRLSAQERAWATHIHPMTLQWGKPLADRFSAQEAAELWARFKPVDDALQASTDQWLPGFQGEETRYYFEQIPATLTATGFLTGAA